MLMPGYCINSRAFLSDRGGSGGNFTAKRWKCLFNLCKYLRRVSSSRSAVQQVVSLKCLSLLLQNRVFLRVWSEVHFYLLLYTSLLGPLISSFPLTIIFMPMLLKHYFLAQSWIMQSVVFFFFSCFTYIPSQMCSYSLKLNLGKTEFIVFPPDCLFLLPLLFKTDIFWQLLWHEIGGFLSICHFLEAVSLTKRKGLVILTF